MGRGYLQGRKAMSTQRTNSMWLAGCLVAAICLFIGAMAGSLVGYMAASRATLANTNPASAAVIAVPPPPVDNQAQGPAITVQASTAEAVRKVLPAVVTVLSQSAMGGGSGTGFFISEEGFVVTNNHVVEGARTLTVIYAQGGQSPASVVGTAPDFDLAVIKVDGLIPAVAVWGDSSELPLGDQVIAIGSALGQYQNTVTFGVLSGYNRELGPLRGLLQTDAAINSGNSGGPLINLAGQVVGINTAVVRGEGPSTSAEGLGFAIPSNVARTVVRRLVESGDAHPSFLGIQYQELNPQLVLEQGLTVTQGAMLREVVGGSPAAQAGLQQGDIILSINGQPVDDRHPLVSLLLEHIAGETVTLQILRDGQTFETELTLGERA